MSSQRARIRVGDENVIYAFSPDTTPVAEISAPASLTVHARDAYDRGCVSLDIDSYLAQRTPGHMNPATGPIGITNASTGDTLHVTIEDIRVGQRGYVATTPGTGLLGETPVTPAVLPFDVTNNAVTMAQKIRLPLRPMVGTIGVAPQSGSIETLSLGRHGGNLDFNDITTGTTIHLPVRTPGALFAIGDVHATMGDGEAHSGVNIDAEIDLRLDISSSQELEWPWFETATELMTVGVADELTHALQIAQGSMELLLIERTDISAEEARALAGAAVDFRLGQAGGYGVPVSVYAAFPRSAIAT